MENTPETIEANRNKSASSKGEIFSRRDFLKKMAIGSLALGATTMGLNKQQERKREKVQLDDNVEATPTVKPEIVHEVSVYGLNEKIQSIEEIERFYTELDKEYERKNPGFEINDKYHQRKEFLNPKERYLEIVAFQSTYDSFRERREETGVDFVEWVKMHVDAMNLVFSSADSELKAVLRRIVVIQDGTLDPIFDMDTYLDGKAEYGPDWPYNINFVCNNKCPFDTDECWVVGSDYRVDTTKNTNNYSGGCFWSCDSINQKIYFGTPPGSSVKERMMIYPDTGKTSLTNKRQVWMDFGMTHEWLHYLFNLPDEYSYDLKLDGEMKAIISNGNFQEPYVSPYLSILSKNHIDKKLRCFEREGFGVGYSSIEEIPESIDIVGGKNVKIDNVTTLKQRENSQRYFPESPDVIASSNIIHLGRETLVRDSSHVIQLAIDDSNNQKLLYIPYLAFNMSEIMGVKSPKYEVELLEKEIDNSKVQHIVIVDQVDIESRKKEFERVANLKPVAKMNIDGTNAYYIWFQQG